MTENKESKIHELHQKIADTQVKLGDANSSTGPLVLAIIGLVTAIFIVGFIILLAAVIWYELRYAARPKLRMELATLEDQLKKLELELS